MPVAIILLPLALAAFAFCALKTLKKLPTGAAAVAWVLGISLLGLLTIVLLLILRQD